MENRFQEKLIYTIFFFSGISGLIYETVWLRMLSRILGSTVYATSIVLSAFMLGLTLGSFFIGRRADRFKKIIRTYAVLEILVGITALLVFFLLNDFAGFFKAIYRNTGENKTVFLFIQAVVVFFTLVIPTFLMGGTLPVLGAAIKQYKGSFIRSIGNLYGLNTFGAVFGVLLSGFVTIGSIGELNTVYLGALINFLVGIVALLALERKPSDGSFSIREGNEQSPDNKISGYSPAIRKSALLGYAVIGFTAFATEVVWTRIFQLQLGTSIYSFSMVLGVYLFGSAAGSYISGRYSHKINDPVKGLGYSLILICFYTIAGLYLFTRFTPEGIAEILGMSKILVPLLIVFPVTFILGFIFPLVSLCYIESRSRIGRGLGFLYSMNTLGCILGSLAAGYLLIQYIGTRNTLVAISLLNGIMGLIILLAGLKKESKRKNIAIASGIIAISLIMGLLAPDPFFSLIKKIVHQSDNMEIYYHKEGVSATVTAYGSKTDRLNKHIMINGIGMTSLVPETKIMAHLPILLNEHTKNILIVCFGMGTCLKSAVSHQSVTCDIVELVGEEYETYNYFHPDGSEILKNPRVNYYVDDGRNFLLIRDKKYDVITIDPSPPLWSAGTVNLYTADFFELCKQHLLPGGIFCLWLPPSHQTEIQMIMKTCFYVFPNAIVYGGFQYPGFFILGAKDSIRENPTAFRKASNDRNIMNDLNEWGRLFYSPEEMLNLKMTDARELKDFLKDADVITDDHPYTEFPLWRKMFNPVYKKWFNANDLKKIVKKNKI